MELEPKESLSRSPKYHTINRTSAIQNETRRLLHKCYRYLSREEKIMVNPSNPYHLLYMFVILFEKLGYHFEVPIKPPKNAFQRAYLYSQLMEKASSVEPAFVNTDWNTAKVFRQKGCPSFAGFMQDLLQRVDAAGFTTPTSKTPVFSRTPSGVPASPSPLAGDDGEKELELEEE